MTALSMDYQRYLNANQLIDSGKLDEAWTELNSFDSTELRDSFLSSALEENEKLKEKIRNRGFYQDCGGNWHEYDDGGGSSSSGGGDGGSCCGEILALAIIVLCIGLCSLSYGECCWCSGGRALCKCFSWCNFC